MRLKNGITKSAIKRSRVKTTLISLSACLIFSTLLGCGVLSREVVVLPESRVLESHPSKEYWTCISDGYFMEILKELKQCAGGK